MPRIEELRRKKKKRRKTNRAHIGTAELRFFFCQEKKNQTNKKNHLDCSTPRGKRSVHLFPPAATRQQDLYIKKKKVIYM